MRIFRALWSRKPQNPKTVPLAKPRLNLALRDRVCTKSQKIRMAPALQEMQNLITKLAQNEYNSQFCQKEINAVRDANTGNDFCHIGIGNDRSFTHSYRQNLINSASYQYRLNV